MTPMSKSKFPAMVAATVVTVVSGTILLLPHGKLWAHDEVHGLHHGADASATAQESEVEIVIQEGGQPRVKGQQTQGHVITLVAGQPAVLAFRNEDRVPREFVSPLFTRAEIHFVGRATGIFRKDAVGFRLNPGSALTLQFMTPYSGFPKMYDVIWCSHDHGKEAEAEAEVQALLIVMTKEP